MAQGRFALLSALCLAAGPLAQGAEVPESTRRRLERAAAQFEPVRDSTGVRGLFEFALEASAGGACPDRVERALELAERMQDRDASSRTFGNFRWYWRNERPIDLNAVEFSMERAVLLWRIHRDRLTPRARASLERLMTGAVEGLRRHRVRESYTNIFLMKTWNCIALGESTGRADLASDGYRMLERWLLHAWESGIHEYLSPTYYGVDVRSLALIARFAGRAEGRALAATALRLFWTDIAANWFTAGERLGGAHSRDYDYVTGRGPLDGVLRRHGWLRDGAAEEPGAFDSLADWSPPGELRELASRTPRFVRQRWGLRPWETAAQHVGLRYSIGSAGATYGTMDKPLVANLPGDRRTPVVCFFMDGRGDPYGKRRIAEGTSGHQKALHLQPFLASAQRGPEVLLAAAADPGVPRHFQHQAEADCLLTQLFFPVSAKVYQGSDGEAIVPGARRKLAGERALFLRSQDVALGIRFPVRAACDGRPAPVTLVGDGAAFGAARLTVEHATSRPAARAVVALWVRGAEGLDEAGFARFRREFDGACARAELNGDRLEVSVAGCAGSMRLALDLAREERLAIEGAEPGAESRLLAADDRDLGREILGEAAPVARYRALLEAVEHGAPGAARCGEVIEAESADFVSGELEPGMDPGPDATRFLWMPEPDGVEESGDGRAVWLVHVPRASAYALWGRVLSPNPSDDSFFVRLDQTRAGGAVHEVEWHTGLHRSWEWSRVTPRGRAAQQTAWSVELRPGTLWLEVRGREKGTRLDALRLVECGGKTQGGGQP